MHELNPNLDGKIVAPSETLEETSARLEKASAAERVTWALERFRPNIILSSSFGAQSAVSLHLVTRQWPEIPVVLIDTGYLFPETYQFIDQMTERLKLNLKVYQPILSAGWQEAKWGKRWERGVEGIADYNKSNKVEPMQRALRELNVAGWFSGLRRQQASTRENLGVLKLQNSIVKIHPIIDWTDRQIFQYLTEHGLPYHPLWDHGYVSIGDFHTTRPLTAGMTEEETRFFGLKRECGLHENMPDVGL